MAARRQVKVRSRIKPQATDEQDAALESVRNVINQPLAAYRARPVDPTASLIVQCPLFFAELADVNRTKVYRGS